MTDPLLTRDVMKHASGLWLQYTAEALDNGGAFTDTLRAEPAHSVIMGYLFWVDKPTSIYELAFIDRLGSYKTIRRRLLTMEERGLVEVNGDGWSLLDKGERRICDYLTNILTMYQTITEAARREAAE